MCNESHGGDIGNQEAWFFLEWLSVPSPMLDACISLSDNFVISLWHIWGNWRFLIADCRYPTSESILFPYIKLSYCYMTARYFRAEKDQPSISFPSLALFHNWRNWGVLSSFLVTTERGEIYSFARKQRNYISISCDMRLKIKKRKAFHESIKAGGHF